MQNSKLVAIVFGLALPMNASAFYCSQHYDNGALSRFANHEARMIYWDNQYRAAPSGSYEERYARETEQGEGREAIEALGGGQALWTYWPARLEQEARELDSKYQSARSGSIAESAYREARTLVWNAFVRSEIDEVGCTGYSDYESVILRAREFDSKFQSAPANSEAERAFRALRERFWDVALDALRAFLALPESSYEYRYLERLGAQFAAGFQAAPANSKAEGFYRAARLATYDSAARVFEGHLNSTSTEELFSLVREYEGRFNSAPANSPEESYFRRVRDELRRELDRRTHPY